MIYLRKFGVPAAIALMLLIVMVYVNGTTGTYAENAEKATQASQNSATNLRSMIGKDESNFGQSAPAQAATEEAILRDARSAEMLLRERSLFTLSPDLSLTKVLKNDLASFYGNQISALKTSLNTTFWRPRDLDGSSKSAIGITQDPGEIPEREDLAQRLWKVDVLRRFFELVQQYRVAQVEKFRFTSSSLESIKDVAPSALTLQELKEFEGSNEAFGTGQPQGTQQIVPIVDPFQIVYQPMEVIFFSDLVGATNLLADLARDGSGGSESRPLFALEWDLSASKRKSRGRPLYRVKATLVAFHSFRGRNLNEQAITAVMPTKSNIIEGGR